MSYKVAPGKQVKISGKLYKAGEKLPSNKTYHTLILIGHVQYELDRPAPPPEKTLERVIRIKKKKISDERKAEAITKKRAALKKKKASKKKTTNKKRTEEFNN